jgi:hypothetical protein
MAAVLFVAACGGDDDEEENVDEVTEYLTQVSGISSLGNTQIQALDERYPTAFEELEPTKEYYADYTETYSRFLTATKQLTPPADLADEHNEFVLSSEAVLQASEARLERLQSAATTEEVDAIFADDPDYSAAVTRQDAACQALKDVAEQEDVDAAGLGDCNNFN